MTFQRYYSVNDITNDLEQPDGILVQLFFSLTENM